MPSEVWDGEVSAVMHYVPEDEGFFRGNLVVEDVTELGGNNDSCWVEIPGGSK